MTDSPITRGRALLALLAALICSVVLLGVSAVDAQAYDRLLIQNVRTRLCLADSGGPRAVTCNWPHDTKQQWIESGMGNGGYRFRNTGTGRCLDMSREGLRMFSCHPAYDKYAVFQSWSVDRVPFTTWIYRMQAFWGRGCLASYSTGLTMASCVTEYSSSYSNQTWFHYDW